MSITKHLLVVCLCTVGALSVASGRAAAEDNPGAVFVMTNAASGNAIDAYARRSDGTLQEAGAFSTGGNGSGGTVDPLHSQGSLLLSADHRFLFAVNAGSGTVSSFLVGGSSLTLVDTQPSGGSLPNALAQTGRILYVLNSKGDGNVSGFRVSGNGHLHAIRNSTRNLSGTATSPTSLAFSPNGLFMVVTESATDKIDVFRVFPDGALSGITVDASADATPFAALFDHNGALIVASASNFVTSYALEWNHSLEVITGSVPTLGMATCWNVIAGGGRLVYTANAASASVSGFEVGRNGSLTAIGNTVVAQSPAGSTNLDMAASADGRFIYNLEAGTGGIGVFSVDHDGDLKALAPVTGLPASAGLNGIAAY